MTCHITIILANGVFKSLRQQKDRAGSRKVNLSGLGQTCECNQLSTGTEPSITLLSLGTYYLKDPRLDEFLITLVFLFFVRPLIVQWNTGMKVNIF